MRQSIAVVLAVLAFAGTGCGGTVTPTAERSDARIAVPHFVGAPLRKATCRLTDMHLRWRFRGQRHPTTGPLSGCGSGPGGTTGSSMDDVRVTGQTPARRPPNSRGGTHGRGH
jgi:hypothetical protein